MSELHERLDRLGLAEYTQRFLDERFDTWKTLSDITEQDLYVLYVLPLLNPLSFWLAAVNTNR